jgi:hypothetical protein
VYFLSPWGWQMVFPNIYLENLDWLLVEDIDLVKFRKRFYIKEQLRQTETGN